MTSNYVGGGGGGAGYWGGSGGGMGSQIYGASGGGGSSFASVEAIAPTFGVGAAGGAYATRRSASRARAKTLAFCEAAQNVKALGSAVLAVARMSPRGDAPSTDAVTDAMGLLTLRPA